MATGATHRVEEVGYFRLQREARKSLEMAKECVIDFVASQWDHGRLEALPGMLRALSGSLDMAGTERAARILDACEHYVRCSLLEGKQVPEWQMLEKLADELGIKPDETTYDLLFTLKSVRCIGSCSLAPVIRVDEAIFGRLQPLNLREILEQYRQDEQGEIAS